jgi:hypothetical protein
VRYAHAIGRKNYAGITAGIPGASRYASLSHFRRSGF